MTLPDIDQQTWDDYEQQRLQQDLAQKQQQFGLQQMLNEKISGLQQLVGGHPADEPAPAPAPEPAPAPPPPPPEPAPAPPPEPVPPPEPPPPAPAPDLLPAPDAAAPPPAPAPEPAPAPVVPEPVPPAIPPPPAPPSPTSASTGGGSAFTDWFSGALNSVEAAGGDVGTFMQNYSGSGDLYGSALNAADKAGANVQQFTSRVTAPPVPSAPTSPAAPQTSGGAGPSGASNVTEAPGRPGPIDSSSPSAFAQSFAPYAQYAAQQLGIDPTWVTAMAASESNYGKAPGNELFGIKALPGQKSQSLGTHEGEYGGVNVNQDFAAYGSPLESVDAYVNLIKNHYKGAVGAQDLGTFVHGLKQGGYFTAAEDEYRGILQSISNRVGGDVQGALANGGNAIQSAGQGAADAVRGKAEQISQFGQAQLSNDEAYAACGPAAAVRFASMFGRNPTLREATDLAASVGWTSGGGMAGLGSEKALMDKLGVATRQVGSDVNAMATEAQTGNPVTISTPGHYFFADGYDPQSGAFHVGQSGLDLRGGSEWMTAAQMESRMGSIQGALFADNPKVPAASTADQGTNPSNYLDRARTAITSKWQDLTQGAQTAMQGLQDSSTQALDAAVSAAGKISPDVLGTAQQGAAALGRGAQAGIDTLEQQRQEQNVAPGEAVDRYLQAIRNRDPGEIARAALDLGAQAANTTPSGGPQADVSPSVSAALTAAGVDPNVSRVLGQGANLLLPLGVEKGAPLAVDAATAAAGAGARAPGAALDATLTGLDRLSPPATASASTLPGSVAADLSGLGASDLNVRSVTPQEARQLVGPAFDPSGRVTDVPPTSGLTPEGDQVLQSVDRGGVPSFLTQNLRRIAADNGVPLSTNSTPNDLIEGLRARQVPTTAAAGTAASATAPISDAAAARVSDLNDQMAQLQRSMPFIQADDARAAVNSEIRRMQDEVTRLSQPAPTAAAQAIEGVQAAPGTPVDTTTPKVARTSELNDPFATPRDVGPTSLPTGARPIELTPEEQRARLNLDAYPQDLQDIVAAHAEGVDWGNLQRRGVISDEVSRQMAERYANDTTLSQTIQNGRAGQAYNAEQTRALQNATGAQAAVVRDAAQKIMGGDSSDVALHRFGVESNRLEQLTRIAEGARAESGRSLRAYQDSSQLINMKPNDAVAEITKAVGGDRDMLLKKIQEYDTLMKTGVGPTQMANFWAGIKNPPERGWQGWVKLVRYNSMLSGPRTLEVNGISNTLEIPWRLARDVTASTLRGRPGEIGAELSGAYGGLANANQAFLDTLFQGITREQALRGELPRSLSTTATNPIARRTAQVLEAPTRLIGAMDEWGKALDYGMSLGRLAGVQASHEGLRGDAWSRRVSSIMASPETAPQLMKRAGDMADRMTFKGDMGNIGSGLQAFTQRAGLLGNIILPFLRTSYHITARGIDRSPLGLVGTGIDVARGAYGRDMGAALAGNGPVARGVAPLGERLGDNLLGSAIFGGLFVQAQSGNISGAGPDSTQDQALLRSQGWQPFSIRVGDKWVSYANWGPAAIPFAEAAAAAETQKYRKPGAETMDLVLDGVKRTAQIATEQTYLQAIGTAWKGLTDPAQYGSQFVNDAVTSMIPFGATLSTVAQAMDPTARRADRLNMLDAIQARLPSGTPIIGGRDQVPAAQNVLGQPLPNPAAGAMALSPLRVSQQQQDPLLQEMDRIGYAPPAAPKSISRGTWNYQLTPDEQRQVYEEAGRLIAQRAGNDVNTPSYARLNDVGKAKRIGMIVTNSRTAVENQFLRGLSPEDRKARQAQSVARKEVVPVSGRA